MKAEQNSGKQKIIQLNSKQFERIMDLGYNMKLVFMHANSIKVVEQIIKIINDMNNSVFKYRQKIDGSFKNFRTSALETSSQGSKSSPLMGRISEKVLAKSQLKQSGHPNRQQLVKTMVEQLFNARQDAIRIQQVQPGINFTSAQEKLTDAQKQLRDMIVSIKGINSDQQEGQKQLSQSFKALQDQLKANKKLLQQVRQQILQKDQKILKLKSTVARLEQHVIRQYKNQGQSQSKMSQSRSYNDSIIKGKPNNDPLIKSQALQRQVIHLKKQIQNLRQNSAGPIKNKPSFGYKSVSIQRQKQYLALSHEYSKIKQQVVILVKNASKQQQMSDHNSQQMDSISNNSQQYVNYKTQYDILSQKYKNLEHQLQTLKYEHETLQSKLKESTSVPHLQQAQHNHAKSSAYSTGSAKHMVASTRDQSRGDKKKLIDSVQNKISKSGIRYDNSSGSRKRKQETESDDQQQIIRNIRQINKMQGMQPLGITSFDSVINPSELTTKIQGFQYNNSIINKVNSSKFIQSFQSKLTLILQYVCIIQLYFTKSFLSCVRQQLMMQDNIMVKPITTTDLNQTLLIDASHSVQENSFNGMNSSKLSNMSSPNRMVNSGTRTNVMTDSNKIISQQLTTSAASLPNPVSPAKQKTRKQVQRLQAQVRELSNLIPNEYLNPHQLCKDQQFMQRVAKLRQNKIAAMISNLVKQNEVFKKCLNQMIKSQQNFTKQNNQVYFDEEGQLRRRSSSNLQAMTGVKPKDKDKQNCNIM